jgi:hypothetical protein
MHSGRRAALTEEPADQKAIAVPEQNVDGSIDWLREVLAIQAGHVVVERA